MAAIPNQNVDDYKRPPSKKPNPALPFPFNRQFDDTPPPIPEPTVPPTQTPNE